MSGARESMATSAPSSSVRARFSSLEEVAITRPAPPPLRQLDGECADPARPGVHNNGFAGLQVRAGAQQVPRGGTLDEGRQRLPVGHRVRDRKHPTRIGGNPLGVPARADEPEQPVPGFVAPDDLAARDHRQRLLGEVGVLGLVRVGIVDARGEDVHDDLAVARLRIGQVAHDESFRAAELGYLDRLHARHRTRR